MQLANCVPWSCPRVLLALLLRGHEPNYRRAAYRACAARQRPTVLRLSDCSFLDLLLLATLHTIAFELHVEPLSAMGTIHCT